MTMTKQTMNRNRNINQTKNSPRQIFPFSNKWEKHTSNVCTNIIICSEGETLMKTTLNDFI